MYVFQIAEIIKNNINELWPGILASGPASNDAVQHTRSVQGLGPHLAENPPSSDPMIVDNGEKDGHQTVP